MIDVSREDYINGYILHYSENGRSGAGGGDGVGKIQRWKKAGFIDGMSVLDYGCGYGAILDGISDRSKYLGVDIVPQAIDLARGLYPECRFAVLSPGKLDGGQFDFVGAGSVFTHTARSVVGDSLLDISTAMAPESVGIIDILEGDEMRNTLHLAYWKLSDFQEVLADYSIVSEVVDKVSHQNGFTHTYLKIRKT